MYTAGNSSDKLINTEENDQYEPSYEEYKQFINYISNNFSLFKI